MKPRKTSRTPAKLADARSCLAKTQKHLAACQAAATANPTALNDSKLWHAGRAVALWQADVAALKAVMAS